MKRKLTLWALAFFTGAYGLYALIMDFASMSGPDGMRFQRLGELLYEVDPEGLNLAQAVIQRYVFAFLWDPVITSILLTPVWIVFGVLALLFAGLARWRS